MLSVTCLSTWLTTTLISLLSLSEEPGIRFISGLGKLPMTLIFITRTSGRRITRWLFERFSMPPRRCLIWSQNGSIIVQFYSSRRDNGKSWPPMQSDKMKSFLRRRALRYLQLLGNTQKLDRLAGGGHKGPQPYDLSDAVAYLDRYLARNGLNVVPQSTIERWAQEYETKVTQQLLTQVDDQFRQRFQRDGINIGS